MWFPIHIFCFIAHRSELSVQNVGVAFWSCYIEPYYVCVVNKLARERIPRPQTYHCQDVYFRPLLQNKFHLSKCSRYIYGNHKARRLQRTVLTNCAVKRRVCVCTVGCHYQHTTRILFVTSCYHSLRGSFLCQNVFNRKDFVVN